jgi:hypothetical protein
LSINGLDKIIKQIARNNEREYLKEIYDEIEIKAKVYMIDLKDRKELDFGVL